MNLTKAKELFQPGEPRRRLIMTLVGIVICAMSGGIMKRAGFGGDPFQMFTNGLDNVLPLDFGTIHVIISGILLAAILKLDKHYIGVATVINLFLTGYIVDLTYRGLGVLFPAPGMALRIAMLVIGLVLFSFTTVFQLITLPVEFNASRRALQTMESAHVLDDDELPGARKVLSAAALTYVAALLMSALQLLRYVLIFLDRRRRN